MNSHTCRNYCNCCSPIAQQVIDDEEAKGSRRHIRKEMETAAAQLITVSSLIQVPKLFRCFKVQRLFLPFPPVVCVFCAAVFFLLLSSWFQQSSRLQMIFA